jgi:hypothetical protein
MLCSSTGIQAPAAVTATRRRAADVGATRTLGPALDGVDLGDTSSAGPAGIVGPPDDGHREFVEDAVDHDPDPRHDTTFGTPSELTSMARPPASPTRRVPGGTPRTRSVPSNGRSNSGL